ncbi:MAG: phosphatidate cytidylyltransferase, partial [Pseudomonadales bacterium]
MLKQRVITGLLLLFILGGSALLLPAPPFIVMAAAIFLLASWEWANLCGFTELPAKLAYVAAFALVLGSLGLYCGVFSAWHVARTQQMLGAACVWWAIALLWVQS